MTRPHVRVELTPKRLERLKAYHEALWKGDASPLAFDAAITVSTLVDSALALALDGTEFSPFVRKAVGR